MKRRLLSLLLRLYFGIRNSWFVWYTLLNAPARRLYAKNRPALSAVHARILANIERDGIAFSSLSELFPHEDLLSTLQSWERAHRDTIATASKKDFLLAYWQVGHPFDLTNPFHAFAIRKEILDIANSYDHLFRELNYIGLAQAVPVGDAPPTYSQQWHRDPEERRMIKCFVYINDVDEDAGPFMYLKGSNYGNKKYGGLFPQKLPAGVYPNHQEIEALIDPSDIAVGLGKAGTVIFCDTAGLHRGGYAKTTERVMLTAFYPSVWWSEPRRYTVSPEVDSQVRGAAARFALGLSRA